MEFYLGTHQPAWLARVPVPLFVSRRRLAGRKTYPRAVAPWALDSGGFSELSMFGRWQTTAAQYASEVREFSREVGNLQWAAIQDHMCEPFITAKTMPSTPHKMAVQWHQSWTIDSYLELKALAPEVPWAPVIQGWEVGDYLRHVEMYDCRGVDLSELPIVGVGSVCRRQGTKDAEWIFTRLAAFGLRMHGFGVKTTGLQRYAHLLESADSMAWSSAARYMPPLPGCVGHKNCANCERWALQWRGKVLGGMGMDVRPQRDIWNWRKTA